jgi:hypothetical protein
MPRKSRSPTAIVQLSKIRMQEQLRKQLEQSAKRNNVSLNGEILGRLEQTFEQSKLLTIDQLLENATRAATPVIAAGVDLALQSELMRAAEALIGRIEPLLATRIIAGREGEAMRQAIDQVYRALKTIELQQAQRFRQMHTT